MELGRTPWRYHLEFSQDNQRRPLVKSEMVWRNQEQLIDRPDAQDEEDPTRLTQTYLEQINANKEFRPVAEFLGKIRYIHVVPQLIRETGRMVPRQDDPYGTDFLEQLASTQERTQKSRLRRIEKALRVAVPQLKELKLDRDHRGVPHLKGLYEHWRPNAGWQSEEQFSDGTLRLLGLLWALLDGESPLLLEEPELSLHVEVIRHIPAMISRAGTKRSRQVLISTHSPDLLSDEGIAPEEVILLIPTRDGTEVRCAADDLNVKAMYEAGLSMADAVMPRTAPPEVSQLALFGS
jgi:predicted ATPase